MMFLGALYWKEILIISFIEYSADRQAYQKESVQNFFLIKFCYIRLENEK